MTELRAVVDELMPHGMSLLSLSQFPPDLPQTSPSPPPACNGQGSS
jgi:hypothetical protein